MACVGSLILATKAGRRERERESMAFTLILNSIKIYIYIYMLYKTLVQFIFFIHIRLLKIKA